MNLLIEKEIWPQNRKVNLHLGFTQGSEFYNDSSLFSSEEFTEALLHFRQKKLTMYNDWAEKQNLPKAKFKLQYPSISHNVCGSLNTLNTFVIDASGNISKCWEHVNAPEVVFGNVNEGIEFVRDSNRYTDIVNSFKVPETCRSCKIYPVCDENFCPDNAFNFKTTKKCIWKHLLIPTLKHQYLIAEEEPSLIESYESFQSNLIGHNVIEV